MDDIEFHVEEEWTAVYLDGKLVTVGDSYYADEWLQKRCGVVQVYDDAFMRGGTDYDSVAQTLQEIEDYKMERYNKVKEIEQLKARIAELEKEL